MVLLALIVTRSSAFSLQAKQGLPFGNQVVGWIVMGKSSVLVPTAAFFSAMSLLIDGI